MANEGFQNRMVSAIIDAFDILRREYGALDVFLLKAMLKDKVASGVYIAEAKGTGLFKIGFASDIKARIAGLQTGCPHDLEIVATIKGDERTEKALHRIFHKCRVRGEWFALPYQFVVLQ